MPASLRSLAPFFAFVAAYALLSLRVENSYYQLMLTLVLVWACFGLSWNMLSGYTGLVSFGHASFFGIGAYATVLGQVYLDLSPWIMIWASTALGALAGLLIRSEEHTSELQSLMRISYAVFCLKKKKKQKHYDT